MPVFTTRKTAEAYGFPVGILLLDEARPRAPGDVAAAASYRYPVLFRRVPGASLDRVLHGDPELEAAVAEAARELEREGVKGIASDSGCFINYQRAVVKAVGVPVFLSSLMQLPFIASCIGRQRAIGIVTLERRALGNRVLALSGVDARRGIIVAGLEDQPNFAAIRAGHDELDTVRAEAEAVAVARRLVGEHPEIGAILLEGAMLPPYSRAVQQATRLPVFDFLGMIDYFQKGAHRAAYRGYY